MHKVKQEKLETHLRADLQRGIGHTQSAYKSTPTCEEALCTTAPGATNGTSRVVEHESVTARGGSQAGLVAVRFRKRAVASHFNVVWLYFKVSPQHHIVIRLSTSCTSRTGAYTTAAPIWRGLL